MTTQARWLPALARTHARRLLRGPWRWTWILTIGFGTNLWPNSQMRLGLAYAYFGPSITRGPIGEGPIRWVSAKKIVGLRNNCQMQPYVVGCVCK